DGKVGPQGRGDQVGDRERERLASVVLVRAREGQAVEERPGIDHDETDRSFSVAGESARGLHGLSLLGEALRGRQKPALQLLVETVPGHRAKPVDAHALGVDVEDPAILEGDPVRYLEAEEGFSAPPFAVDLSKGVGLEPTAEEAVDRGDPGRAAVRVHRSSETVRQVNLSSPRGRLTGYWVRHVELGKAN